MTDAVNIGYNLYPGGEGGCTPEASKKIIKARHNNGQPWLSAERNRNVSIALTGHKQTAETRKKNSDSHMGQEPWNKGLTSDDPRIKAGSEKQKITKKKKFASGELTNTWNKGKTIQEYFQLKCPVCGQEYEIYTYPR